MTPFIILAVVLLIAIAGFFWWRRRKRLAAEDHEMLSFVGFLREPMQISPERIKAAAHEAFGVDLVVGDVDGADRSDGFIIGHPELPSTIMHMRQSTFMINNFPVPYLENPEAMAEEVSDLRLQPFVAEHKAWFSCDAMGVESFDSEDEIREWYRLLGWLFCQFLDENCLAIFLPQTGQLFPNSSETIEVLTSRDPLSALVEESPLPVLGISGDDPAMQEAVAMAKERFPEFASAFAAGEGESFGVKAPITGGGKTEFIWLSVTSIDGETIHGELANDPMDLGELTFGSRVSTSLEDLNDWAFVDAEGNSQGLFTLKPLAAAQGE